MKLLKSSKSCNDWDKVVMAWTFGFADKVPGVRGEESSLTEDDTLVVAVLPPCIMNCMLEEILTPIFFWI